MISDEQHIFHNMQNEMNVKRNEIGKEETNNITPVVDTSTPPAERGEAKDSYEYVQPVDGHGGKGEPVTQILSFLRWWLEDQWFLLALAILIVVASQVQVPQSQQELKTTIVTYLCVSLIFFLTGCTLSTRTLLENYSRWQLHLFVQVQCFLMTSAIIYGVVSACATNRNFMDAGLLIGLIFEGCVATTISSNVVMTRTAHGNTALTVVQSTVGNFLSPFLTPALVSMYTSTGAWYTQVLPTEQGGYGEIYRRVFKQLGLSIFLPLVKLRPGFYTRLLELM
jgi:sodium/bile acid cotransporter 7